jgi:hypothetical protein
VDHPGRSRGETAAGEAGAVGDVGGVEHFGQGHRREDGGEPVRQHRYACPRWRIGQHTGHRTGFTKVTAGTCEDLPWLEAPQGTVSQRRPSDRRIISQ